MRAVAIMIATVVVASVIEGCGPPARKPLQDPFFDDDSSSMVSGDFDQDEAAWRKELARAQRHHDNPDALLKDDPPRAPEHYGNVVHPNSDARATTSDSAMVTDDAAATEGAATTDGVATLKDQAAPSRDATRDRYAVLDDDVDADAETEAPPPTTFWGKVQAAAHSVGRASFAAITVVVTLGMMAAPYLLL